MMDREQYYEYADIWVKDYLRKKCDEINDWLCYKAPAYGGEVGKAKAIQQRLQEVVAGMNNRKDMRMRYTVIDGIAVIVDKCSDCPFFSTEFELSAECRYPHAERREIDMWGDEIDKDCPLKEE